MAQSTEQLKEEISEQYLKDFKKELGWLKSLALLPIEKNVKKILTGAAELPDKFNEVEEFGWWKDIINFISPETAKKILNFMKEKRLEIEKRKTEQELQALKNEILGIKPTEQLESGTLQEQSAQSGDNNQQPQQDSQQEDQQGDEHFDEKGNEDKKEKNSAVAGAVVSGVGFGATVAMGKLSESANYRKLSEGLDAEKIRGTINSGIDALKHQRQLKSRLSTNQLKSIDKHISRLEAGLKEVGDDDIALLKLWGELDRKLPKELVKNAGLSQSQLLQIEKIADKLAECKDIDEMKALLKSNNITGISDEVLVALKNAENVSEIKKMTKILRYGSRINRFIQTLAGAMLIDVACLGLDVWVYLETQKEAELIERVNQVRAENKRNQAAMQLGIGVGSVLVEGAIIAVCTLAGTGTGGPVGALIGLAVGSVATAASMGVDSLYFDVNDFYLQNKEDFIRQKKSKINQAILQGYHNKKKGNSSMNESIHEYINGAGWFEVGLLCTAPAIAIGDAIVHHPSNNKLKEKKETSLGDACWSMIFLDELENGKFSDYTPFFEYLQSGKTKDDYLKDLNEDQRTQFEEKWKEMTDQIALRMEYIDKVFQGKKIIEDLEAGKGMDSINNLFTESRIYSEIKSQGKWADKSNFETNLRRYKETYFSEFPAEKLQKIEKLKESNSLLYKELIVTASLSSLLGEDEDSPNYTENVKLVKKYQDWIKLTQSDKEKIAMEIPDSHKNVNFIEKLIRADFDLSKVNFTTMSEQELKETISGNEIRNGDVELSDDPFQNTLYRLAKELFGYTGKNQKSDIMEFYSEEDGNVHGIYYKDEWIINNDWAVDSTIKGKPGKGKVFNSQEEVDAYVNSFINKNMNGASIDTATEAIDDYLQSEFENRFRTILKEELSPRTKQNQQKIKNEITNFVKQQAKNGEYVELPYYLVIQARKAGLGDLQRHFYTRKGGKLEVCLIPSDLTTNTLDAKITYLSPSREEFTEEEKVYIERVERAHQDVENIRVLGGTGLLTDTFIDELDLPKEIEIIISDKYKEWEKFKSDMLMYSADSVAKVVIYEQYKEFAEYFENLYRGILLSLTTYSVSNDIDSYILFSKALCLGNGNYFDEQGLIKSDIDNEFLKNLKLKSFYEEQINKQRVEGKTVKELWSSEKREERELGLQASNEILTAILEQSMVTKDNNGKITNIHIGNHWFDSDSNDGFEDKKGETERKISERLAKIGTLPEIEKDKIDKISKKQSIKQLKKHEKKVVKEVPELQNKIEARRDDIIWQGKRGNIEYNPEKGTLRSWGQEIKIEEKNGKYFIEGFNHAFADVKVMLWVSNFRNWSRTKFHGKTIAYDWDLFNSSGSLRYTLVAKESWPKSDTSLIPRYSLETYFPACKNDEVLKAFAEWINKEVNE